MYQVASSCLTYRETALSGQREPLVVLQTLLDAGLFSSYMLYQREDEVRVVGNSIATVAVSAEAVSITYQGQSRSEPITDPLKQVESALAALPIADWTAYGYVGFDLARFYYPYSKAIQQPLLYFSVPEIELLITPEETRIRSLESSTKLQEILLLESNLKDYTPAAVAIDPTDQEQYQTQISKLITAIQNGELHKAIVSRAVKIRGELDILGTYQLGAVANPSARSYCLQMGGVGAVGFSPEILMSIDEDGFIITNPLAGTRPRSPNSQEDTILKHELLTDAKEVKEHALSLWLAQEEMLHLCIPESVQIFDFMQIKQYRCVQHLSSRVGGQLKAGTTLWDAVKVLFPGITVSGIDKHRALHWIDQLEVEPRGLYAGGIGWVNSRGMADLAIAIRSAYQYGEWVHLNAGAGIVAESIPQKEYIESVNKMNTMLSNLVLKVE